MMTIHELAGMLDGSTYGNEVNKGTAELAKENGLVIVFGASDYLMEFRGAIDDEADVYNGGTVYLDENGLFRIHDCSGDEDRCPYLIAARDRCKTIAALWNERDGCWAWEYQTAIPHADFRVFDGDDNSPYCRGIVFNVEDLKSVEVVPVVRCGDCEHFIDMSGTSYPSYCYKHTTYDTDGEFDNVFCVESDKYCAWGERRAENETGRP